jgi:AcrR family transcriptional regulator
VTSVNDEQRVALLSAASDLLAEEGPGALSVRRIAAAAGTSTMGVYSRFGGKDGIVEALYVEGFELLRSAMATVPATGDPVRRLLESGRAYRRFALDHPTHYLVMFEAAVPDFVPTVSCHEHGMLALAELERIVAWAIAEGALDPGDSQDVAHVVWASTHGPVSLELHGMARTAGRAEQHFDQAQRALLRGLGARDVPARRRRTAR